MDAALVDRVRSLPWFHSIDLGGGVVTPGATPLDVLERQVAVYFRDGLAGLSVLDVGCWDGFNSFEAKRRGARRVLATDHFAWSEACWGSRDSFELAREQVGVDVEVLDIDLPDLTPAAVGRFDVVLFAGVLYHLRDRFGGLTQVGSLCERTLIVETHVDPLDVDGPAMVFYPGGALADDPTNWWGPNPACVTAMLDELGFSNVLCMPHPVHPNRAVFHASRSTNP
jgi:tRNA (mo5U34)-methyltransferase